VSIRYFGHACFLITSPSGFRLLTDPYHEGLGLRRPDARPHVVTVSHPHPDHSALPLAGHSGVILPGIHLDVDRWKTHLVPVSGRFYDYSIQSILSHHGTPERPDLGLNAIFRIEVEGLTLVHLGDLGRIPDPATLDALTGAHVLLIPVGGTYTIGASAASELVTRLAPRVVIPMHYALPGLKVGLDGPEPFLATQPSVTRHPSSTIALAASGLARGPATLLLAAEGVLATRPAR
jgi:L-ascorbate metabolism protein UlaG (beta-lactamase superfamily)